MNFWNTDIQADIILSETPKSRNVSVGTSVVFTCATPETGLSSFTLTPGITLGNTMEMTLPNGDRQLTLSFIAPSKYQMLTISCVATRLSNMGLLVDFNSSTAVLMIQGERLHLNCVHIQLEDRFTMVSHNYDRVVCFCFIHLYKNMTCSTVMYKIRFSGCCW